MLVAEKLREIADAVEAKAEGLIRMWTFVDLPYPHLCGLRRLTGHQPAHTSGVS